MRDWPFVNYKKDVSQEELCLRADVSYFLYCTRAIKEIGDVCKQARKNSTEVWLHDSLRRKKIKFVFGNASYFFT